MTNALRPYAVAVGDINHDGWLDIVTVNSSNANVSVFLNSAQPNGTFAPAVTYPVGSSPHSLVLADLNDDGNLDVAVANYAGSSVSVLLANADGTLQPMSTYPVGGQPNAIAVGDLDGDGSPDLVAAGGAGITSLLFNTGSGAFQPAQDIPSDITTGLAVADFNADGKLDIASTSNAASTERITVRYRLQNGTFDPNPHYITLPTGGGFAIRAANVFQDEFPDLLTANTGNGTAGGYSYRKGDALGNFSDGSNNPLAFIPFALEVGDLDGNDLPDLLFVNNEQSKVSIALGNGGIGTFQTPLEFSTGSRPYSVAVGDFNQDGKLDVVTANFSANSISVLINTIPTRTFTGRILFDGNSSVAPVTFVFHPQDNSGDITRTVMLAADGSYTLRNIPPKLYDVTLKRTKWLHVKRTAVDAVNGNVTDFNATLLGGDANNDNTVDIGDLLILISSYNKSLPSSDYKEVADFNDDGANDIVDLNILISHYNTVGQ